MQRLVVDVGIAGQLYGLSDPVELCDESGRVLGHFMPGRQGTSDLSIPFSDEELARREQETRVCTTEELLARLRAS